MAKKENLFFTKDEIQQLATSRSYERGYDYYLSGEVGKIIKRDKLFEGVVNGSRKYNVSLDISNNELNFNCNCPYDFDGICKHKVAIAFEIIEGNYTEKKTEKQRNITGEEFDKIFSGTNNDKVLSFLKQLLDKNNNLKHQFIEFTKDISQKEDSITPESIDDIKK
ncbi:hypothetical protein KAH27_10895 [bacterium]|nr:hypothetical protein [bacterium]